MKYEILKVFCRKSNIVLLCTLLVLGIFSCLFYENDTEKAWQNSYIESYKGDIERVIKTAALNRKNLPSDSYLYEYNGKVIEKYTALLEKDPMPTEISGFDSFIICRPKPLFFVICAVLFGSIVTQVESECGMTAVNFISNRAKRIYLYKGFAIFAVSLLTAIVYFFSQLLVFLNRFGGAGLFSHISSVQYFKLCPYDISVFKYILLQCLFYWAFALALSLSSAVASKLFGSQIISIFAGSVPIFLYFTSENGFDMLFSRYFAVNLASPLPLVNFIMPFVLLLPVFLLLALYLVPTVGFSHGILLLEKRAKGFVLKRCERLSKIWKRRRKFKRRALLFYELKKVPRAAIIIVIFLFLLKCRNVFLQEQNTFPYEDAYRASCTELSGNLTEQKQVYVKEHLRTANKVIAEYETVKSQMMNEEISHEDYRKYLEDYYAAEADMAVFSRIWDNMESVKALKNSGKDAKILYDTGWQKLFFTPVDIYLYFSLLLLFCSSFSLEEKCGMITAARVSGGGEKRQTAAKVRLSLLVSTLLYIIFTSVDMFFILSQYSLPNMHFPAVSIVGVSSGTSFSLISMLVLRLLKRLFAFLLLSVFLLTLSKLLKKVHFVLPAAVLAMLLLNALQKTL